MQTPINYESALDTKMVEYLRMGDSAEATHEDSNKQQKNQSELWTQLQQPFARSKLADPPLLLNQDRLELHKVHVNELSGKAGAAASREKQGELRQRKYSTPVLPSRSGSLQSQQSASQHQQPQQGDSHHHQHHHHQQQQGQLPPRRVVRRHSQHHNHLLHLHHHGLLQSKGSKPQPRRLFRSFARLTVICVRLCKISQESLQEARGQFLSILQVLDDFGTTIDRGGLFFDPDDFRANKQDHIPQEAVRILKQEPHQRSERDIAYLMIILRNIPAFAEYPTRMQKKLCKVAWYESYEPRRAVIREGHPPHSFYFILSGTVLVTRFEPQSGSTQTLVSLEQGLSFGELAVITGSRRQATVSTKTRVELLCISAFDFEDIFMSGGMRTLTDPDHNAFLRSVAFLKHWPLQELLLHPKACMFHYFNRGQVLVRDSNNSDWIYIVKSGSLSVLKKLQHVTSGNDNNGPESSRAGNYTSRRQRDSTHAHPHRNTTPDGANIPEVFRNQMEADRRLEQSLPGVFNVKERLGLVDYDRVIGDYRARVLHRPGSGPQQQLPLRLPTIPGASGKGESATTQSQGGTNRAASHDAESDVLDDDSEDGGGDGYDDYEDGEGEDSEEEVELGSWGEGHLRPVSKTAKGVYLACSPLRRNRRHNQSRRHRHPRRRRRQLREAGTGKAARAVKTLDAEPVTDTQSGEVTATSRDVSRGYGSDAQADIDRLNIDYQRRYRERVGRKTMADQLDYKGARDFRYSMVDFSPMFVLVQVLERGQYFGMSQLMYPELQPSLCLVSNGAELIVLSKRLFMEKASEACIQHCRLTESPYPAEEVLQSRLQDYVNWEAHRARVYRRLVTDIQDRHARRKQYLPSIPGQYCFRSGPT